MDESNVKVIDAFFDSYSRRDMAGIRRVMAEDVRWTFPGRHPLSGVKDGLEAVIAFFDTMGGIMGGSNVRSEKLITGADAQYVVECQHVWTNRADGHNLDHLWCVVWRFEGGKIVEGRHFAADQYAVDAFFGSLLGSEVRH